MKNNLKVCNKPEANLQYIFDATDTIYVLMDNDLRVITYNCRAFDFAEKQLGHHIELGGYFLDYFPVEKRSALQSYINTALAGKPVSYEVNYGRGVGLFNWYHVRIFLILKDDKNIYGLLMAVSDITEKKLIDQRLLEQKIQEQKKITRIVLDAQETEKNMLGIELQDNVGQLLSTAELFLDMTEQNQVIRKDVVGRSKEIINKAIREIRLLNKKQLTPQKQIELKELIEDLINNLNTPITIKFQCKVTEKLTINDDLKLNIYRIIQEQINNILKYSLTQQANIVIDENNGIISISIVGEGQEFDAYVKRKGISISNMVARVESYNGKFTIDTTSENGCKIEIRIPLL